MPRNRMDINNKLQEDSFELEENSIGKDIIIEEGAMAASGDEEQGMFEHFRMNIDAGQTPMRIDKYMS